MNGDRNLHVRQPHATEPAAEHQPEIPIGAAPSLGNVDCRMIFANHATAEDASRLSAAIAASDIYVPEQSNWDDLRRSVWQAVSDGAMTPDEALAHEAGRNNPFRWPEFFKETLGQIHGTGKIIVLADLPAGSPVYAKLVELYTEHPFDQSLIDWSQDFDGNRSRAAGYFESEFELHAERERHILGELRRTIETVDATREDGSPNPKICITIGVYHQNLAAGLRSLAIANVQPELALAEGETFTDLTPGAKQHTLQEVKDLMSYARAYGGVSDLESLMVPYMAFDLLEDKRLGPAVREVCRELLGLQSSEWADVVGAFRSGKLDEQRLRACFDEIRQVLTA